MIPRSVLQKRRENLKEPQPPGGNGYRSCSHTSEHSFKQPNNSDTLVKTDLHTKPNVCSVSPSLSSAISHQENLPLVHVGPITRSNKVPKYVRSKQPANVPSPSGNLYTGLAWNPQSKSCKNHTDYRPTDYHGRFWECTMTGYQHRQQQQQHGFTFTLMTYNVLAQVLLERHRDMYYSESYLLQWSYRKRKILQEIKHHKPDVICLQEVQHDHYRNFYLPELQAIGYEGTYLKRPADKEDGCATFYNTFKFKVEEIINVPYTHTCGGDVLNKDNVGLIVKLEAKSASVSGSRTLVVANTHILFNPRRGDVKLAQVMMLLAEIDKCAFLPDNNSGGGYHPVVICGDFNTVPQSELYKLLVMGQIEYDGVGKRDVSGQEPERGYAGCLNRDFLPSSVGIADSCQYCDVALDRAGLNEADSDGLVASQCTGWAWHNLHLVSVYEHWCKRNDGYYREVTTHHGYSNCTVDYIFYGVLNKMVRFYNGEVQTKDVQEGKLKLLGKLDLLTNTELAEMGSLPNKNYGSDHLALVAQFLLT